MAVPLSRPVSVQGRGTLPHNKSSSGSVATGNNSNSSRQTKVVTISYTSKQPISSNPNTSGITSVSNQSTAHHSDGGSSSAQQQQDPSTVVVTGKGKKGSKEKPPPPPRDPKTTKSTGSSKSSLASSASGGGVQPASDFPPPPSPLPSATEQTAVPHSHASAKEAKNCTICNTSPGKDKKGKSSKRSSSTEGSASSSKGAKSKLFSRKSMPERDKSFEIEEE